jgi:oxygen-independent coproporphyrinogen-3 oxidase
MTARASSFGVYVHFPYCLSKCPYCDFASVVAETIPHRAYAAAIARELERRAGEHGRPAGGVESVYFGGGTPSLWDPACVGETLATVDRRFGLAADCEVTLEANPGASDAGRFAALRAAGVNRLSIGVQSFHPAALAGLGRRHTPEEAVAALERARAAGFPHVSIDLIFGAPTQTPETAYADARRAVELGTDHLSFYGLTLEGLAEDVRLAKDVRRGRVQVPDDGAQARMGAIVREVLEGAGFARYEISNFARPGAECRHNLLYWRGGPYAAAGCGAWGFRRVGAGGFRYGNPRKPEAYLAAVEAGGDPAVEFDRIDAAGLFTERLFLGLRLVDGLDLDAAVGDTVGALPASTARAIERLVGDGLLEREGSRLRCTERGLEFHTEVAVRLLPDEPDEKTALPVIA